MTYVAFGNVGAVDFSITSRSDNCPSQVFLAHSISAINAGAAEAGVDQFLGGHNINLNITTTTRNLPPFAAAELHSALEDLQNTVKEMVKNIQSNSTSSAGGKGSWLRALAEALGKALDSKAAELENLSNRLDGAKPSVIADHGAVTKEFAMLFEGAVNAIKTIGEALTTGARK